MYATWFVLVLGAALLLVAFRRIIGKDDNLAVKFVPVAWAYFTLRLHETLLFGIELQWAMGAVGFLAATYLVDTLSVLGLRLVAAIGLEIVSSFSFADGLLVWPIGLIQLLLLQTQTITRRRTRWAVIALWCASGVGVFFLSTLLAIKSRSTAQACWPHSTTGHDAPLLCQRAWYGARADE